MHTSRHIPKKPAVSAAVPTFARTIKRWQRRQMRTYALAWRRNPIEFNLRSAVWFRDCSAGKEAAR